MNVLVLAIAVQMDNAKIVHVKIVHVVAVIAS